MKKRNLRNRIFEKDFIEFLEYLNFRNKETSEIMKLYINENKNKERIAKVTFADESTGRITRTLVGKLEIRKNSKDGTSFEFSELREKK